MEAVKEPRWLSHKNTGQAGQIAQNIRYLCCHEEGAPDFERTHQYKIKFWEYTLNYTEVSADDIKSPPNNALNTFFL